MYCFPMKNTQKALNGWRYFTMKKINNTVALKIYSRVEHDANSALERFKNYYSTLAENLANMLPKSPHKYSINTVVKYYHHMI